MFNSKDVLKKQKETLVHRYTEDSYIDYSVILSKSSRSSGVSEIDKDNSESYKSINPINGSFESSKERNTEFDFSITDETTGKIMISKMSLRLKNP